jgi:hypothetical protein
VDNLVEIYEKYRGRTFDEDIKLISDKFGGRLSFIFFIGVIGIAE